MNATYFQHHPHKILGTIYPSTDRFGKPIEEVRGTINDVIAGIKTPSIRRYDHFQSGQKLVLEKTEEKIKTVLEKTKKESQDKVALGACHDGLQCLEESILTYNKGISKAEMKVWITYQVNRGGYDKPTILNNDWSIYYEPSPDYLKSQLGELVAFDGENYIPALLYYSGNIYQKIQTLKERKQIIETEIGTKLFEAQAAKLEASKPTLLRLTDGIEHKLTLAPFDKILQGWKIGELADGNIFEPQKDILQAFQYDFLDGLPAEDFVFERLKSSAFDIRNHWLNRSRFANGTEESEKAARKRAAQSIGAMLFDRFLWEALTREDRLKIEYTWNSRHNNYVDPDWNKIPVGFEINQFFKGGKLQIRPAQREGVAFLNTKGTGIIAYDVGVGKTMTAILYLADMLAKGLCRRPLIVVPNPTYEKWRGEINGVFAKKDMVDQTGKIIHQKGDLIAQGILPQYPINDYYNLGTAYLHRAKNEEGMTLKVGAYSITMVTYEGLMKIGFSVKSETQLVTSIKAILSQGETGREAALIEEQIAALVDKSLNKSEVFIEDMGIDAIVVDEAHNFKNLFTQVRGQTQVNETGDVEREVNHYELQGKTPSARAVKLFMLNRYIQLHHHRRNTIGLTATPFTNSPLEIYSMQALFDYDGLKEHGIENIVDYFNAFINESYEAVWTSKGRFEPRAVVRGFNNLPTMQAIIFKYILYKTGEEANIQRPQKIVLPLKNDENGIILPIEYQASTKLPATEEQRYWFSQIADFARGKSSALNTHYPADRKGKVPGRDLICINAAQLATLSPYLLPWLETDESEITPEQLLASSPKLRYVIECIRSVKTYHEKRKEAISGQIIYANRGTKFFPHLRDYLIQKIGFAPQEVAIIMGGVSIKKKERIKQDFLEGKVKVIIGSATIREGIDLQKKSSVLYNCYLDWNPTDIQQLEGRIWRFGNMHSHVRIVVPLIENSFDIFLNQKLGEKTSRVNNIWQRAGRTTVLKLEELNPDELKKGLISDPAELVKMEVETQSQDLEIQRDLLLTYIKQLREAEEEKKEAQRIWSRLHSTAQQAMDKTNYYSFIDPKRVERIVAMKITAQPKSIYQIVKRFAHTRRSYEKYQLEQDIDLHLKKAKKLLRIERDILAKNDLTLKDNFFDLIQDYEQKVVRNQLELAALVSDENKEKLFEQFVREREAGKLNSRSLQQRVQEFARLNFLLECKDADFDGFLDEGKVCSIYGINRGKGEQPIKVQDIAVEESELYTMSKKLRRFMPTMQRKVIAQWPEETKKEVLMPLENQVASIPKRQEVAREDMMVYAHFFYGGSDWYITEWDEKDIVFGYTILNGDVQMSELGSIYLPELTKDGRVELNFHWTPKYLDQVLYEKEGDYFEKPKKRGKEEDEEIDKKQKMKRAKAMAAAQAQRIRILELETA